MDQLKRILAGLTAKQKLLIALVAVAVAASLAYGVIWNRERHLRPLFTALSPEDSGALIEKLKSANVPYKVADNGTILVPEQRVAELRIEMAAAGLPRTGRMGFELFDKTNLGTTDFAEHVNYRRAIEGELERSVLSIAEVEKSRVHVTFAKESVFLDQRQPAKASVMVKLKPRRELLPLNVKAIQHLVSSAVENLLPVDVSVLDMEGNLLSKPKGEGPSEADLSARLTAQMVTYRQNLENEYLSKIRQTLDPLLGPNKYRAGVSLDCDFSTAEQSEETFDPDRSVMTTSSRSEDASGSTTPAGAPGTASNLPRPLPRANSVNANVARKSESIAYQTSRVVKHTKLPLGSVRRVSVSVILDQPMRWEGVGDAAKRVFEPPTPESLKIIKDTVAGVVGFRQDRNDQISVESLPFEATLAIPRPPEPPKPVPPAPPAAQRPAPGAKPTTPAPTGFQPPAWMAPLLKKAPMPVWIGAAAALLIVFGLIGFLVVRMLLKRRRAKKGTVAGAKAVPGAKPGDKAALAPGETPAEGAAEPDFEQQALAALAENVAERDRKEREALASLQHSPTPTKKSEVLKKVLGELAKENPEAVAQLIRTWITDKKERTV